MAEDNLQAYRDVSKRDNNVFFNWLNAQINAAPVEEARKLTEKIKEPIGKVVEDE